jgi:glycosyltransferase involved in cell wall biosynthesis
MVSMDVVTKHNRRVRARIRTHYLGLRMICGTFLGKTLEPYRSDRGDLYGATVAENQLIQSTLVADTTLKWEFWKPGLPLSVTRSPEFGSGSPDVAHLQRQFGNRILVRGLPSLPTPDEARQYVFMGGAPLVPVFADVREQLLPSRLPICGVLHAACFPDLAWQCARILLSVEECDAIVATSRAGHQALETAMEAGAEKLARRIAGDGVRALPRPRIVDIPLGTDVPSEEALHRERARSLLNLPQDAFCVLFIGRLTQGYKADLDVLLGAVARLGASGREVRLILAGQSPNPGYIAYLRAHLAALQLAHRTLILENFPEFLKSSILAACDVFAFPVDSIQETFGIAAVEAMAHARPVIATNWSGLRDLVVDGETGFLLNTKWPVDAAHFVSTYAPLVGPVELADYLAQRTVLDVHELVEKLSYLAGNPEAAAAMGRRARERVIGSFSWPRVAKQYLELWADQIERAQHLQAREKPAYDHGAIFSHYADAPLSSRDVLAACPGRWTELNITDFWWFANSRQIAEIRDLIQHCRMAPAGIADLIDRGYSLDCILWLAKKGICRIVSPNVRQEPMSAPHAVAAGR